MKRLLQVTSIQQNSSIMHPRKIKGPEPLVQHKKKALNTRHIFYLNSCYIYHSLSQQTIIIGSVFPLGKPVFKNHHQENIQIIWNLPHTSHTITFAAGHQSSRSILWARPRPRPCSPRGAAARPCRGWGPPGAAASPPPGSRSAECGCRSPGTACNMQHEGGRW